MKAYVFPGQGSQMKGMGNGLFDKYVEYTKIADEILGYSIKDLCLNDPNDYLSQTQFTQPALFTVNALEYLDKTRSESKPDYTAGHSLGEYNALFAAGVIDFATGIKLVKKRGALMSQASGGGMAAVLGLCEAQILKVLKDNKLDHIYIANDNSPGQIVISGWEENIQKAKPFFEEVGARAYIVLKVSGAFHSQYMEAAKKEFAEYLQDFDLKEPVIPVIANMTARPYKIKDLKSTLVNQITNPVRWTDSMLYLLKNGIEEIIQVGPGEVLTGLTRQIKRAVKNNSELLAGIKEEEPEETPLHVEEELQREQLPVYTVSSTPFPVGSKEFQKVYNLRYPYIIGSMYKGISSADMVIRSGKAGILGFFGAGGLSLEEIEDNIIAIESALREGEPFGIDLIHNTNEPEQEEKLVDLLLKHKVKNIEASAYISITPALARYKIKGLKRSSNGMVISENRIFAKLSRPEVAENFLSPINENLLRQLLETGSITEEEAALAKLVPVANEITAEADSAGHTDGAIPTVLWPTIIRIKERFVKKYGYLEPIHVGAAGGIGTPEAAVAAFVMGVDYIVTGSINQCTPEAATSDKAKELLAKMQIQDTEYAPAGDMFELGARVQVLKKGLFFPIRANKLYELYRNYDSIEDIDEKTKEQIQMKYFHKTFREVYEEVKGYHNREKIAYAEKNPKNKMALIFKWYFGYATRNALMGSEENIIDYQIYAGSALGAFNEYVKGTELENWKYRHVDNIAVKLMEDTKRLIIKFKNENI